MPLQELNKRPEEEQQQPAFDSTKLNIDADKLKKFSSALSESTGSAVSQEQAARQIFGLVSTMDQGTKEQGFDSWIKGYKLDRPIARERSEFEKLAQIEREHRKHERQPKGWATKALRRGIEQYMVQPIYGTAAWAGSALDQEGLKEWGIKHHRRSEERVQRRYFPDVESIKDIRSPGQFLKWTGENIISLLPQAAKLAVEIVATRGMLTAAARTTATGAAVKGAAQKASAGHAARLSADLQKHGMARTAADNLARHKAETHLVNKAIGATSITALYNSSMFMEALNTHGIENPVSSVAFALGTGAVTMAFPGQVNAIEHILGRTKRQVFQKMLQTKDMRGAAGMIVEAARIGGKAAVEEFGQESLALANVIHNDELLDMSQKIVAYMENAGRPLESALTIGWATAGRGMAADVLKTPFADKTAQELKPGEKLSPDKAAMVSMQVLDQSIGDLDRKIKSQENLLEKQSKMVNLERVKELRDKNAAERDKLVKQRDEIDQAEIKRKGAELEKKKAEDKAKVEGLAGPLEFKVKEEREAIAKAVERAAYLKAMGSDIAKDHPLRQGIEADKEGLGENLTEPSLARDKTVLPMMERLYRMAEGGSKEAIEELRQEIMEITGHEFSEAGSKSVFKSMLAELRKDLTAAGRSNFEDIVKKTDAEFRKLKEQAAEQAFTGTLGYEERPGDNVSGSDLTKLEGNTPVEEPTPGQVVKRKFEQADADVVNPKAGTNVVNPEDLAINKTAVEAKAEAKAEAEAEAEAKAKEVKDQPEIINPADYNKPDLQTMAKDLGISGISNMNKTQLAEAVNKRKQEQEVVKQVVVPVDAQKVKEEDPSLGDVANHLIDGINNLGEGLVQALGLKGDGKTMRSGIGPTAEQWTKAKELFQASYKDFQKAGHDLKVWSKAMKAKLTDTYKPLIDRFVKEVEAETKAKTEEPQKPSLLPTPVTQKLVTPKDIGTEAEQPAGKVQRIYDRPDAQERINKMIGSLYVGSDLYFAEARERAVQKDEADALALELEKKAIAAREALKVKGYKPSKAEILEADRLSEEAKAALDKATKLGKFFDYSKGKAVEEKYGVEEYLKDDDSIGLRDSSATLGAKRLESEIRAQIERNDPDIYYALFAHETSEFTRDVQEKGPLHPEVYPYLTRRQADTILSIDLNKSARIAADQNQQIAMEFMETGKKSAQPMHIENASIAAVERLSEYVDNEGHVVERDRLTKDRQNLVSYISTVSEILYDHNNNLKSPAEIWAGFIEAMPNSVLAKSVKQRKDAFYSEKQAKIIGKDTEWPRIEETPIDRPTQALASVINELKQSEQVAKEYVTLATQKLYNDSPFKTVYPDGYAFPDVGKRQERVLADRKKRREDSGDYMEPDDQTVLRIASAMNTAFSMQNITLAKVDGKIKMVPASIPANKTSMDMVPRGKGTQSFVDLVRELYASGQVDGSQWGYVVGLPNNGPRPWYIPYTHAAKERTFGTPKSQEPYGLVPEYHVNPVTALDAPERETVRYMRTEAGAKIGARKRTRARLEKDMVEHPVIEPTHIDPVSGDRVFNVATNEEGEPVTITKKDARDIIAKHSKRRKERNASEKKAREEAYKEIDAILERINLTAEERARSHKGEMTWKEKLQIWEDRATAAYGDVDLRKKMTELAQKIHDAAVELGMNKNRLWPFLGMFRSERHRLDAMPGVVKHGDMVDVNGHVYMLKGYDAFGKNWTAKLISKDSKTEKEALPGIKINPSQAIMVLPNPVKVFKNALRDFYADLLVESQMNKWDEQHGKIMPVKIVGSKMIDGITGKVKDIVRLRISKGDEYSSTRDYTSFVEYQVGSVLEGLDREGLNQMKDNLEKAMMTGKWPKVQKQLQAKQDEVQDIYLPDVYDVGYEDFYEREEGEAITEAVERAAYRSAQVETENMNQTSEQDVYDILIQAVDEEIGFGGLLDIEGEVTNVTALTVEEGSSHVRAAKASDSEYTDEGIARDYAKYMDGGYATLLYEDPRFPGKKPGDVVFQWNTDATNKLRVAHWNRTHANAPLYERYKWEEVNFTRDAKTGKLSVVGESRLKELAKKAVDKDRTKAQIYVEEIGYPSSVLSEIDGKTVHIPEGYKAWKEDQIYFSRELEAELAVIRKEMVGEDKEFNEMTFYTMGYDEKIKVGLKYKVKDKDGKPTGEVTRAAVIHATTTENQEFINTPEYSGVKGTGPEVTETPNRWDVITRGELDSRTNAIKNNNIAGMQIVSEDTTSQYKGRARKVVIKIDGKNKAFSILDWSDVDNTWTDAQWAENMDMEARLRQARTRGYDPLYLEKIKRIHFRLAETPEDLAEQGKSEAVKADADKLINKLRRSVKGVNAIRVEIHETPDKVPQNIVAHMVRGNIENKAMSVTDRDTATIHVFLWQHKTTKDAGISFLHESVGHIGLKSTFPNDNSYNAFLDSVGKKYQAEVAAAKDRMIGSFASMVGGVDSKTINHLAAEEVVAGMVQRAEIDANGIIKNKEIGTYLDRMVNFVLRSLRKTGLIKTMPLTKPEIRTLIAKAYNGVNVKYAWGVGRTLRDMFDPSIMNLDTFVNYEGRLNDRLAIYLQDGFRPLLQMQEALRKSGVKITDELDAHGEASMYKSRTGGRLHRIMDAEYFKPLINKLQSMKLINPEGKTPELDQYILAVREREMMTKGVRYNTPDPATIKPKGVTQSQLNGLIADIKKINSRTLDLMSDYGLRSEKSIAQYREHLLLAPFASNSVMRELNTEMPAMAAVARMQQVIQQGQKNEVKRKFYNMIKALPAKDFNQMFAELTRQEFDYEDLYSKDGILEDPNQIAIWVNGDLKVVNIKHDYLAKAMNNLNTRDTHKLLQITARANRVLAAALIKYNPQFWLVNLTREILTGVAHLHVGAEAKGMPADTAKVVGMGVFKAARALNQYKKLAASGKPMPDQIAGIPTSYIVEYEKYGIQTGYYTLADVGKDKEGFETLQRAMLRGANNPYATILNNWDTFSATVGRWNENCENAMRIGLYTHLRNNGWTEHAASLQAKDMAVNFDRRGTNQLFNSLHLFFNAAVQGPTMTYHWMKQDPKKAGQLITGIVVAGFVMTEMARFGLGEDDDGVPRIDKISEWILNTNVLFPFPWAPGEYFSLPKPYVFGGIFDIGRMFSEILHGKNPTIAMFNLMGSMNYHLNPVGGEVVVKEHRDIPRWIIQTLSGTLTDPLLEVFIWNQKYDGTPIMNDQEATFFQNIVTGTKHILDSYGGGASKMLLTEIPTNMAAIAGGHYGALEQHRRITRRWLGKIPNHVTTQAFWSAVQDISELRKEENTLKSLTTTTLTPHLRRDRIERLKNFKHENTAVLIFADSIMPTIMKQHNALRRKREDAANETERREYSEKLASLEKKFLLHYYRLVGV